VEHSLDHLVINSHFALETVAGVLRGLGFTLTPRGYHSLGSLNHLLMFDDHYLEIVGLLREGKVRQELLDSPAGIDGLVLASKDAHHTQQQLEQAGFRLQPLQHFSREVVSGKAAGMARFTTLRLAGDQFSAGRVYFCQHHTPEWVWRPEWLGHPNGVDGIVALTVVADDPQGEEARYRRLGELALGFALRFITREEAGTLYGDLLVLPPDRKSFFSVIHLQGGNLDQLAAAAAVQTLPFARESGVLCIALPTTATLLEFLP